MSNFYAICELGEKQGRVMMATLQRGRLTMSEIHRFTNVPITEKHSSLWNIPQLYQETLQGLAEIGNYEEPICSVSCTSWGADCLTFDSDGALSSPTPRFNSAESSQGLDAISRKIPLQAVYSETGLQNESNTTLLQLAVEKSRRFKRARQLMPVGDGFNYLLSGVPRVEMSLASTTQLYDPFSKGWSTRLQEAFGLSQTLLPAIVPAGTPLGMLRREISEQTRLHEARVIASCSHELAAGLMGIPLVKGEQSAFLQLGDSALIGTQLARPLIDDDTRQYGFSNSTGFGGATYFHKRTVGLSLLEECRQYWKVRDKELDADVLTHLAACSEPFESLIDPADPRFSTTGDMPLKIQAFCKETNQNVPRKPGSIVRCILESLALHYVRVLRELESLTGRQFVKCHLLDGSSNTLLNHFTANAIGIPVVIASPDARAIGNALVQALALGHVQSREEAHEIVRNSFKAECIIPRTGVWHAAFERAASLKQHENEMVEA